MMNGTDEDGSIAAGGTGAASSSPHNATNNAASARDDPGTSNGSNFNSNGNDQGTATASGGGGGGGGIVHLDAGTSSGGSSSIDDDEADKAWEYEYVDLDVVDVSLFENELIPPLMRYGVPVYLFVVFVALLSSQIGSGFEAITLVVLDRSRSGPLSSLTSRIEPEEQVLLDVNIFWAIAQLWVCGIYFLTSFLALASILWPYLKVFLSFYAWIMKPSPSSSMLSSSYGRHGGYEHMLMIIDVLGKWSFAEFVVFAIGVVIFRITLQLGSTSFELWIVPEWGYFGFIFASIFSLIGSHVILYYQRQVIFAHGNILDQYYTAGAGASEAAAILADDKLASAAAQTTTTAATTASIDDADREKWRDNVDGLEGIGVAHDVDDINDAYGRNDQEKKNRRCGDGVREVFNDDDPTKQRYRLLFCGAALWITLLFYLFAFCLDMFRTQYFARQRPLDPTDYSVVYLGRQLSASGKDGNQAGVVTLEILWFVLGFVAPLLSVFSLFTVLEVYSQYYDVSTKLLFLSASPRLSRPAGTAEGGAGSGGDGGEQEVESSPSHRDRLVNKQRRKRDQLRSWCFWCEVLYSWSSSEVYAVFILLTLLEAPTFAEVLTMELCDDDCFILETQLFAGVFVLLCLGSLLHALVVIFVFRTIHPHMYNALGTNGARRAETIKTVKKIIQNPSTASSTVPLVRAEKT